MENSKKITVGVIVGRFQSPYLHDGYRMFFEHVLKKKHDLNVCIIGVCVDDVRCTKRNPLSLEPRRRMIMDSYPNTFTIGYIKDMFNNEKWCEKLDGVVEDIVTTKYGSLDNVEITFYGSRDSFVQHYVGKHKAEEYISPIIVSSTQIRANCANTKETSQAFREGVIWFSQQKWNNPMPTIDCAIRAAGESNMFFFGRKKNASGLCFIGGFVDVSDGSYENAAIREAKEETGLNCTVKSYITSTVIDDKRYRHEVEKIYTSFYLLEVNPTNSGIAKASDDMDELHLKDITKMSVDEMQPEHRVLFNVLLNHLNQNN